MALDYHSPLIWLEDILLQTAINAILGAFGFLLLSSPQIAMAADVKSFLAPDGKPILEISASPEKGFNFPYLLYIPVTQPHPLSYLLVEMNNTPDASQDTKNLSLNEKSAVRQLTSFSFGNGVTERLGTPLLVPIFPRPLKADKNDIYTFALSREALLVPEGPLRRIDLQLVAMINDARRRLSAIGRPTQPKVMITGFSASAMFASRFVFLHPDLIQAAAFGAVNSFFMVPEVALSGQQLEYPLGLADYQKIVGHSFDAAAYRKIPEFAFMGANDDNDAVAPGGGDAYTAKEADLILNMFGKQMMPERWSALRKVYASNPAVVFHTYSNVGHGLDERIWRDTADFLAAHSR